MKAGLKSRNATRGNATAKHQPPPSSAHQQRRPPHDPCGDGDAARAASHPPRTGHLKGANSVAAPFRTSGAAAYRPRPSSDPSGGGRCGGTAPTGSAGLAPPSGSDSLSRAPPGTTPLTPAPPRGPQHPPPPQYPLPPGVTTPNGGHPDGVSTSHSTAEMALSQKNHRLAKELSDLRVRHREETRVVSRLTMENMNLASRCREAISQVATLKKELSVYQKRQSEWGTLQREVMLLRKQINKSALSVAADAATTISLTQNAVEAAPGGLDDRDQVLRPSSLPPRSTDAEGGACAASDTHGDIPTTDLDRIMAHRFLQRSDDVAVPLTGDGTGASGIAMGSVDGAGKDGDEKQVVTDASCRSLFNGHTNEKPFSANTVIGNPTKGSTLNANNKPTSSNSKVLINVNPSQNEDEFDADLDMVDFFAKSHLGLVEDSLSASTSASTELISSLSEPSRLGNHTNHASKLKVSTDDHMPGDVVSPPHTGHSPPHNDKTPSLLGDNLLSSLDAFEASFASAFPETSFSITSEAPLSSAKLDMSFDVPDFDPFFQSPSRREASTAVGTASAGGGKSNVARGHGRDPFPDVAVHFCASPPANTVFDATTPVVLGPAPGPSRSAAREERSALRPRGQPPHPRPAPLSPHSMSAESAQLDVLARLAPMTSGAAPPTRAPRAARKVKQPASYAEPSTKSKLRRGDVHFQKVDAANRRGVGATELDRIMSQKMTDDP